MRDEFLSLLGLCAKAGKIQVGEDATDDLIQHQGARLLLAASDAAPNTLRRIRRFAEDGQCLWLQVPYPKAELGHAVGFAQGAVAAISDIGFAAALVHKLAQTDPKRYGELAEKLDLKAKRAAERRDRTPEERQARRDAPPRHPAPAPEEPRDRSRPPRRPSPRFQDAEGSQTGRSGSYGNRSGDPRKSNSTGKSFGNKDGNTGKPFRSKDGVRREGADGQRSFSRDKRSGGQFSSHSSGSRSGKFSNPYAHSRPVKKGKGSVHKKTP